MRPPKNRTKTWPPVPARLTSASEKTRSRGAAPAAAVCCLGNRVEPIVVQNQRSAGINPDGGGGCQAGFPFDARHLAVYDFTVVRFSAVSFHMFSVAPIDRFARSAPIAAI